MPRGRPRKYGPAHPGKRFLQKNKAVTKSQVLSLLNKQGDRRYVDNYSPYTVVNRVPVINRITYNTTAGAEIIQGDGQQQRESNEIQLKSMNLKVSLYYSTSAVFTNPGHTCRMVIFRWNENIAGGAPTDAQIMQFPSTGVGFYESLTSPINWDSKKAGYITVLHDKTYSFGAYAPGKELSISKKLTNKVVWSNNVAISGTGHIYIYFVANDPTGGVDPQLYAQYHSRIQYNA